MMKNINIFIWILLKGFLIIAHKSVINFIEFYFILKEKYQMRANIILSIEAKDKKNKETNNIMFSLIGTIV